MKFVKFLLIWIASNLSVPFWVIGSVHLSIHKDLYDDITILISQIGMNIIVAIGFWLDWQQNKNNLK
jgi:hypothetical protein